MSYFATLEKAYMSDQFTHNSILYDNENGLGNIPLNRYSNASYRGWVCYMTPSVFLSLTPKLAVPRDSLEFLLEAIKNKEPIATPFLRVEKETWQVDSHEGRHRMTAIKQLYGDIEVPVQMSFAGIRASSVELNDIAKVRSGVYRQQPKTLVKGPLFDKTIDFQGKTVVL